MHQKRKFDKWKLTFCSSKIDFTKGNQYFTSENQILQRGNQDFAQKTKFGFEKLKNENRKKQV